jgi:hypothetical protein
MRSRSSTTRRGALAALTILWTTLCWIGSSCAADCVSDPARSRLCRGDRAPFTGYLLDRDQVLACDAATRRSALLDGARLELDAALAREGLCLRDGADLRLTAQGLQDVIRVQDGDLAQLRADVADARALADARPGWWGVGLGGLGGLVLGALVVLLAL